MLIEKSLLKSKIENQVGVLFNKSIDEANEFEIYQGLSKALLETISKNWLETRKKYETGKQAFYFSAEFLMGRALGNNLINLGLDKEVKEILKEIGFDLNSVEATEEDAGLGNGGLGRLAACFMDSLVTLNLPGQGYGIKYKNGIFKQKIVDGFQVETPETWLRYGDVWTICRPCEEVVVEFGDGKVRAVPYDMPVIGYGTKNVNTLRLWEAKAMEELNLKAFNDQDYDEALKDVNAAEDISRILYPNDSTNEGKKLRLKQQYFFTSASLQDIIRKFKKIHGTDFEKLPEFVSIQLNDTHPVIAIPELMRILCDVEGLLWNDAWAIAQKTFAYTNHTILSEALEKWWIGLYEEVVPRIFQITQRIHFQFLDLLEEKFPKDKERRERMSIIQGNLIHMAWLAIYGSFATNGVAALHTDILKHIELKEWYELFPERFLNKTNGITQRRWLLEANPELSKLITELIGDKWITDFSQMKNLEKYVADEKVTDRFLEIKSEKKKQLAQFIEKTQGIKINPDSIFDIQIKRLHEYKRQLLNILHILDLYYRLKENPNMEIHPVTYIFGAKSAPGYMRAKGTIRLINEVAQIINNDPEIKDMIKVVFIENYNVSSAALLFPAADISEQISTAGKEASGTGNMKFMINGALTFGTLDGANVEIVEEAGIENNYIFGLKVEDIEELKKKGYDPHVPYEKTKGLKRVVDALIDGTLNDEGTGLYKELYDSLLKGASWHKPDQYFVLEDFEDFRKTQEKINKDFADRKVWAKKAWINISNGGKFSSDRTIEEYAKEIWKIASQKI
ncbi:glycogen/starch/alpha-glucan phosphorylase [Candidatus Cetobacterium colombiensis]|uniref:Alpha-1,4 glucan phosphorylase n=1 Tax=Candidatus Cetobacterium colombiensis TaxID=3073100 RepID=A0ABU4W944_9FUSO|nr:glycogen/starch/alpha-glucan phosphorylase [Candidatus Cetobacterium colombiensis]MDX8336042.1 glycogen/starch/alpha-glucan phosphorylase [Candidatus Cetobacterium colombiensis]